MLTGALLALAGAAQASPLQPQLAYIGPGVGFAAAGSVLVLVGTFFLALGIVLLWPLKAVVRLVTFRGGAKAKVKRCVVIGLDGLDPELARQYMAEGRMPNLAKLASLGGGDSSLSTPDGLRVAIPMGRAGHVTDVSNSVVFLASKLSAFITGTTLHPDGGTFASSGWFNWPESGWANHVPSRILAGAGPADATGA